MTNTTRRINLISAVFFLAFILLGCKQGREQAEVADKLKNEGDGYPEIGKPCPPFTLGSITYYHKEQASLEDFKGKPLILDFWTRSCRSCIASFPKVNRLQEQFGDQVRFMLVSREDGKNKGVREVYERFRKRYKLNLPVSYTAELFDKFGVTTVPHVVWIDGEGVVKAITSGAQVKAENIQDFIAGKELKLFKKPNREEEENMARQEESAAENGDTETTGVLYRSELTGVNRAVYNTAFPSSFAPSLVEKHSGFRMDNVSVEGLYRLAYTDTVRSVPYDRKNTSYGKFWARPVLEVTDSSAFEFDREAEKGVYCYRLKVPENKSRDPLYVQQIMRRDLKNYFGYDVQVETRPMPCWKLTIASEKIKRELQTQGGKPERDRSDSGLKLVNRPVHHLIIDLWGSNQLQPPFIDETGITGNIDISLEGFLGDFKGYRTALRERGLILEKGKKNMKVIVIRDPKD